MEAQFNFQLRHRNDKQKWEEIEVYYQTLNRNDKSTSISTQLDSLIPASEISTLTQGMFVGSVSVSYTHLDVYKRQTLKSEKIKLKKTIRTK